MNQETVGIVSILVWEILLGITPLVYKFMDATIPSSVIVAIRFGLGSLVLLCVMLAVGKWKKVHTWNSKQIVGILFLGIFGSGLASLWNVVAIRHIGVVLSSLLTNLELPFGVFLGHFLLKEHLTKTYLKASSIILLGYILLTIKNGITLPVGGSYTIGVIASLGAAIIWGACTVVGKKLVVTTAPIVVAFMRLLLGALTNVAIFMGSSTTSIVQISTVRSIDWLYFLWLGVITSGIGFVLFYKALQVLSVKKISLFFLIAPIVSVLLGIITGEQPELLQWIGIILIFGSMTYLLAHKDLI